MATEFNQLMVTPNWRCQDATVPNLEEPHRESGLPDRRRAGPNLWQHSALRRGNAIISLSSHQTTTFARLLIRNISPQTPFHPKSRHVGATLDRSVNIYRAPQKYAKGLTVSGLSPRILRRQGASMAETGTRKACRLPQGKEPELCASPPRLGKHRIQVPGEVIRSDT